MSSVLLRFLLITLLGSLALPTPAAAQQTNGTVLAQDDLDGDGRLDRTTLAANLGGRNDRVLVYDGIGNMARSDNWQTAVDHQDDTWIFDQRGDGSAQLIVRFSRREGDATAEIYDDHDRDAQVDFTVEDGLVQITESPFPTATVIADGQWLLPDGSPNWNVRFLTDGPVQHLHTYNLTEIWLATGYLVHDGQPEISLEFTDRNRDGIPEHGIWRLLVPTSIAIDSMRTWIWSNEAQKRPALPTNELFWPWLSQFRPTTAFSSTERAEASERTYFDEPPALLANFNGGIVQLMVFPGYPIEAGYHVHTLEYFQPERLNYANFENVQAYYDLAGNSNGIPELHLRHRYFEARDRKAWNLGSTVNELRWSWNQFSPGTLTWDYKLGLAGRIPISSEIEAAGYRFRGVPYQQLPEWVLSQPWDYATFVALEGINYPSLEGIYEWAAVETALGTNTQALSQMLSGDRVGSPEVAFADSAAGMRGEFAPRLSGRPQLYLSPIDQRLHLYGATFGIWRLDSQRVIHMSDLDSDGFFDRWTHTSGEDVESDLILAPGHLLFAKPDTLRILAGALPTSSFLTEPPHTTADWKALGERIPKPTGRPFEPETSLEALGNSGPQIIGAGLRGYRLTDNGFRFILSLSPGFTINGEDLLGLAGRAPGDYAVTYDGAFQAAPLTPPAPALQLRATAAQVGQPVTVRVDLWNTGLDDLESVTLSLSAMLQSQEPTLVTTRTVNLFAGVPTTMEFNWFPPASGDWTLSASLDSPGQVSPTLLPLTVTPGLDADATTLLQASGPPPTFIPIIGLLTILALIAGAIARVWYVQSDQESHHRA